MKSHEFIQAAANMLSAFSGQQHTPQADITASGKLHQVEPELVDRTERGGIFVAPPQAELELLKKAVNIENIYDENIQDTEDELDQMKKLSGINLMMHDKADQS
jgi:hypothetical protein